MFPANYVVVIDLDKILKTVVARYDFDATKPDRISFKKGERIAVLAEVSADWWTGRNAAGETGLFPSNYVAEEEVLAAPSKASRSAGNDDDAATTKKAAPAAKSSADGAKMTFTSATLKDFPIQFKMPSQTLPSLKIGSQDDSTAKQARSEVKSKLAELNGIKYSLFISYYSFLSFFLCDDMLYFILSFSFSIDVVLNNQKTKKSKCLRWCTLFKPNNNKKYMYSDF